MKSIKNKVHTCALIEIGGSHDECLYTQMAALKKAGTKVILITTHEIYTRNRHFDSVVDDLIVVETISLQAKKRKTLRFIYNEMKVRGVQTVICNTAQGTNIRILCLMSLFSSMKFIGIVHTTRKFRGSFTQKIINLKIKKYFFLSEYLLNSVTPPFGITFDYFYPLHFPDFNQKTIANQKELITIIGGVENRRKDLDGFLRLIEKVDLSNLRFIFLGKSDFENIDVVDFRRQLKDRGLIEFVTLYDKFVTQNEFDAVLKQSTAIMPLVHPNTPSADQYFKNQISGAMTVSFGYKIPLLIHEAYLHIEELSDASLYYNFENFDSILDKILEENEALRQRMKKNKRFDLAFQEQKYMRFVLNRD